MKYVLLFLFLAGLLGLFLSGGPALSLQKSHFLSPPSSNQLYSIDPNVTSNKTNLQLITFNGVASTPTPTTAQVTPSPTTGTTPTPTSTLSCQGKKLAVDFLLDTSSSMKDSDTTGVTKIDALRNATKGFVSNLVVNSDIIGMQVFSSPTLSDVPHNTCSGLVAGGSIQSACVLLPFDTLVNTSIVNQKIDELNTSTIDGDTWMRDGLNLAKTNISNKLSQLASAGQLANYKPILIFVSDGQFCCGSQGVAQNPDIPPNPAIDIQNLGVTVITIAMQTSQQSIDDTFAALLCRAASPNSSPINNGACSNKYFYQSTPANIAAVLNQIRGSVCQ